MSFDLRLDVKCNNCGTSQNLYGSNCKHMTLCTDCGKNMAQNKRPCATCRVPITRLIREYNVRATPVNDKHYFVGRFVTGLPNFPKKKSSENKWSLKKEGNPARQPTTDAMKEKFKNRPWLLEDQAGQLQYHGLLEGTQSATYYLLMLQGKEFQAIPAGSWYNFSKVAQYKQLTLEEAEEKIKNRKKNAEGYERWMMRAANDGAAAFGKTDIPDDKEKTGAGRGRKKALADGDEGNFSDMEEEDEEEEESRKNKLGLKKGGGDDEEGLRGGDHDFEDDDIEKGDDWEHEELFTDDDEQAGGDEDNEDNLAAELPAPPEIKQDEEDEVEDDEEEGGLSQSGKEMQQLIGRVNKKDEDKNNADAEDDDDDEDDDDETNTSPVLAPKSKQASKGQSDTKPAPARGTPSTSKSSKSKRKATTDEGKGANGTPIKKVKVEVKIENESRPSTKAIPVATGPVTEEEIKAVLLQTANVTTQELVAKFKARLRNREEKDAFSAVLKRISRIKKTAHGTYVVFRDSSEKETEIKKEK